MTTFSNDHFIKTSRKVRVTFAGWDGKSYGGEGRTLTVYKHPNMPDKDFVRASFKGDRCYHMVTDKKHPVSGERMVEFFDYYKKD